MFEIFTPPNYAFQRHFAKEAARHFAALRFSAIFFTPQMPG